MGTEIEAEGNASGLAGSSKTEKHLMTWAVYYCTFAFGVGYTFLGPTVLDFSEKFDVDVDVISVVFTILTASYLFGALGCGILFNFFNRQVIVMFLLASMAGALFLIPNIDSLAVFFVLNFFLGFGAGGYDCAQISWIIDIWRGEAAPFILAQHFAYSVGTIVPPLILAPFLTAESKDDDVTTTTTLLPDLPPLDPSSSSTVNPRRESKLFIPFSIAGVVLTVAIGIQVLLFFKLRRNDKKTKVSSSPPISPSSSFSQRKEQREGEKHRRSPEPNSRDSSNSSLDSVDNSKSDLVNITDSRKNSRNEGVSEYRQYNPQSRDPAVPGSKWTALKIALWILSCCVIGSYQGMELTTMQFLPTFSHFSELKLSDSDGATILFWLTLAFAVGRGVGIIIVLKIRPQFILLGNFILLIAANMILLFVAQSDLWMLRIGSILMGLALSTVFPAFYAFIEKYLYVTDTIVAVISITGGGVSAIYPVIVGNSVERNPSILIYVNIFSIVVLCTSFATCFYLTVVHSRKFKR